jgi:thiol-disulfide isomerase/thioredoxin
MQRRQFVQGGVAAWSAGLLSSRAVLAQTGAKAPGPVQTSMKGVTVHDFQPFTLERQRGKVVLVFFWSISCAVCRDKLPEFRVNYEAWRDKGFELVAVNTDPKPDDLQRYVELIHRAVPERQQFPIVWRGDARHSDNFGAVTHVPTSFFVDRQGRVVKEIHGRIEPALWDDIAEMVLA